MLKNLTLTETGKILVHFQVKPLRESGLFSYHFDLHRIADSKVLIWGKVKKAERS
jgi:hypothetical protein